MTINGSSDLFRSEVVICWNDPASSKLHICTNLKNGRTYLRTKISNFKETWQILSFNWLPVNIFIINLQQIRAEHLMFKICSSNITFLTYFFCYLLKVSTNDVSEGPVGQDRLHVDRVEVVRGLQGVYLLSVSVHCLTRKPKVLKS